MRTPPGISEFRRREVQALERVIVLLNCAALFGGFLEVAHHTCWCIASVLATMVAVSVTSTFSVANNATGPMRLQEGAELFAPTHCVVWVCQPDEQPVSWLRGQYVGGLRDSSSDCDIVCGQLKVWVLW